MLLGLVLVLVVAAYHDWEEPILRTLAAAQEAGVDVITPRPGETYEHGRPFASAAWYAARTLPRFTSP